MMTTRKTGKAGQHAPQAAQQPVAELAAETLQLITDFEALVRDETVALDNGNFEAAEALQKRKFAMTERYQGLADELRTRRDDLRAHHPELRDRLLKAREGFSEATRANVAAIERRRHSSQRLVDRLIEAARRGLQKSSNYSKSGQRVDQPPGKVSFGLNQTL